MPAQPARLHFAGLVFHRERARRRELREEIVIADVEAEDLPAPRRGGLEFINDFE